eukprot:9950245-Alexandrium_andersonii.AAC.1
MLQGEGAGWARAVSRDWRHRCRSIGAGSARRGGRRWDVRWLAWRDGPLPSCRQGNAPGPWGDVAASTARGQSCPRRPTCGAVVSGRVSTLY